MEGAWATRSGDMSRRLTQATLNGADLASSFASGSDRSLVFRATDVIAWNFCPLTKKTTDPLRRRRTGDGGRINK
jgi:hypothetical protein